MIIARRFLFVTAYMTLALGGFLLTGCSNQSPLAPEMPDAISTDSQVSPNKTFNVLSFAPETTAPRLGVKLTTGNDKGKFKKIKLTN